MTELRVSKIHCSHCAEELIGRMKEIFHTDDIYYEEESQTLSFPEEISRKDMERILSAEKIRFLKEEPEHYHHSHDHDEHDHHHSHSHHHHHSKEVSEKGIRIVFFLNVFFSILEFIFGSIFRSAAIQSDAVHDMGDALSIGFVWIFEKISTKHGNEKFSFGHRRFSLLGALITNLVLIIGSLFAIANALPRLIHPVEVNYSGMTIVAVIAIAVNGIAMWILSKGSSKSESLLNLHMLEDLAGWAAILIISFILRYKPWYFLDSLASLAIAGFILYEAVPSLKEIIEIFLEAVPDQVEYKKLLEEIGNVSGVHGVSHLHLWSVDGEDNNFNVTVFTDRKDIEEIEKIKEEILKIISPYHITCSTIEVDYDPEKWNTGYHGE